MKRRCDLTLSIFHTGMRVALVLRQVVFQLGFPCAPLSFPVLMFFAARTKLRHV